MIGTEAVIGTCDISSGCCLVWAMVTTGTGLYCATGNIAAERMGLRGRKMSGTGAATA